ncbi:MAG: phosphatidylglycerophosphatase A, partial [Burkholderiales bacterium]|nr:phosphatidylglycerophosphatase A [Burkholderiales bacterium]
MSATAVPGFRFLFRHPAHFIAFGGGAGLAPVAPGTFGTLLALPLFHWLAPLLDGWSFLVLVVALFWLGVWASSVTGRALGVADHGGMVWDETVAFLLVLFFVPVTG